MVRLNFVVGSGRKEKEKGQEKKAKLKVRVPGHHGFDGGGDS